MAVKPIPAGMHTVTPTLAVEGAAEAIEFYKKAFGAEELSRAMDPSGKKIWHAAIRIGDSPVFLADASAEMGNPARTTVLWMYLENVDASFKRATDAGATVVMPPADMFWGDRYGQVADKWGNKWGMASRIKELSEAEMKKAGDEFAASMQPGKK